MLVKIALVILVSYQISIIIGACKELYDDYKDWVRTEEEIESQIR